MAARSRATRTRQQVLDRQNRQERVINHARANGGRVEEILEACDVPRKTYDFWRVKYDGFAQRFDEARRSAKVDRKVYDGSFTSFRSVYLKMETTWFQAKIIEAIEKARPGEVTLVLIPPGHGKTTLLEDWCTYKLVSDPSFRITVASETVDHGAKIVDRVRDRLEMDGPTPEISRDFGPLSPEQSGRRDQTWGQRKFDVAQRRSSDERDFSMNCVGITGRVQGTRCDLLLLDDIQDVKSIELSDKYYEIITQSFLTRPEMFGRTVIIGTRVGERDVYSRLIANEIPDKTIKIPAYDVSGSPGWPKPEKKPVEDDPSTWAPEGVKFLWPEKYNQAEEGGVHIEGLERYRYARMRFNIKEPAWWRNYMQRPEAASSMTFDKATIEAMYDETRSVLGDPRPISRSEDPTMSEEWGPRRPVPIIIGVDPAVGGGNGVLSVAARPKRMEVLSAHLDYSLTKYSQIIDLIEEDCHRFSTQESVISVVVIEDKAFQKGLLEDDRMLELQKRFGFRIVPNTTGREKADKDIGVPSMPMAMTRQEITIPWADAVSQTEMALLIDQLGSWRPGVNGVKLPQDLVMALWFCYRQWRAIRNTPVHQHLDLNSWRATPSPLRPQARRIVRPHRPYRSLQGGHNRWR